MTTSESEFIKAITSFKPIVIKEEYRAYYDNDNKIMYLMANQFPDDNNNWISITRAQYQTLECQWLWLEKGHLVERKPVYNHYFSLTPSTKGVKIVKNHAGIVVEQSEEYADIGYYDKRNS
jgi:hypothetical protein